VWQVRGGSHESSHVRLLVKEGFRLACEYEGGYTMCKGKDSGG
jgi:hypothetical protein